MKKLTDYSDEKVIAAYNACNSLRQTLRVLDINVTGTQIQNLKTVLFNNDVNVYRKNNLENLLPIIKEKINTASSFNDLAKQIGYLGSDRDYLSSRQYDRLRKFLTENNFHYTHLLGRNKSKNSMVRYEDSEVFCEDSKVSQTTLKKRYMLYRRLNGNIKCDMECGVEETWNNTVIVLQIDHKNGNRRDNRYNNLRLLCPNCHSQTSNFAGRSR